MAEQCDIAIIGGGLAGLSLACVAADAGYNVALFEKEEYPFHKVCGEYISFESYDFLDRLGLPLHEWNVPIIKKLQLTDIRGKAYNFLLDLGGFGISRYKLDNALYQLALKKGVHVFTNTKVNDVFFESDAHMIQTNKQSATAKIVAGSFGKRSNLDVKWKRSFAERKVSKLNNYIGVKYHVHSDFSKDEIALHNFKNGYCGISAIEDDKYCLCYLTNADNLSANNNSIKQMQENVLYENPALKEIFTQCEFLFEAPVTISQISFDKKSQTENHALMLGDAAGMITPLCGNGMSMAMHSALLAFEQINLFLQKKALRTEMEKNYEKKWKESFSSRLATGRLVQRFMGNNSTSLFLEVMSRIPVLSKKIIQLTHGKRF
ncbi:MAG TPA: NAD(P)/FAD-dependent oxidoreductase [Parafilimonas sp.]|nr:NAD(P)/FAD-dependent oxidoreductase [Parafilimonas sp.]